MSEPWPGGWLSREVAATATVVHIGSQGYHQVVAQLEDEPSREFLRRWGYRLCRILADPRNPRLGRRGVYRRRIPAEES